MTRIEDALKRQDELRVETAALLEESDQKAAEVQREILKQSDEKLAEIQQDIARVLTRQKMLQAAGTLGLIDKLSFPYTIDESMIRLYKNPDIVTFAMANSDPKDEYGFQNVLFGIPPKNNADGQRDALVDLFENPALYDAFTRMEEAGIIELEIFYDRPLHSTYLREGVTALMANEERFEAAFELVLQGHLKTTERFESSGEEKTLNFLNDKELVEKLMNMDDTTFAIAASMLKSGAITAPVLLQNVDFEQKLAGKMQGVENGTAGPDIAKAILKMSEAGKLDLECLVDEDSSILEQIKFKARGKKSFEIITKLVCETNFELDEFIGERQTDLSKGLNWLLVSVGEYNVADDMLALGNKAQIKKILLSAVEDDECIYRGDRADKLMVPIPEAAEMVKAGRLRFCARVDGLPEEAFKAPANITLDDILNLNSKDFSSKVADTMKGLVESTEAAHAALEADLSSERS